MVPVAGDVHSAGSLRRELSARNLERAEGMTHELTFGRVPQVVYAPDETGHGNFLPASYKRILAHPEWSRRLAKAYTAGARLPRRHDRRRGELECAGSSDALLMNTFCYPGVLRRPALVRLLGVEPGLRAEFGVRVHIPMREGKRGRAETDRTEMDMRLGAADGPLLCEAKLTETGFQTATPDRLLRYADVEDAFDLEQLPRAGERFAGYQLVRGVLAAQAAAGRYTVILDARRYDLREQWFRVLAAVRRCELRMRLSQVTWQEIAAVSPPQLQEFMEVKYGIVATRK